jgi:hypothetical protein
LSVIFGAYTASFNQTDKLHARIGVMRLAYVNAESIAKAGAGIAFNSNLQGRAKLESSMPVIGPVSVALLGGTAEYRIERIADDKGTIVSKSLIGVADSVVYRVTATRVAAKTWALSSFTYTNVRPPNYAGPLPTE